MNTMTQEYDPLADDDEYRDIDPSRDQEPECADASAKEAPEPMERHLALLGRALDILINGEAVAAIREWSPRPKEPSKRNTESEREAASLLLEGLARSLERNPDPALRSLLGEWTHRLSQIPRADAAVWSRLLDQIIQPKLRNHPNHDEPSAP